MIKLQISLTDEENQLLAIRAASLGYDVTKYAKFLLAREAVDRLSETPIFAASSDMIQAVKEARNEYKTGKIKAWPAK
jgi:hypothetical protein